MVEIQQGVADGRRGVVVVHRRKCTGNAAGPQNARRHPTQNVQCGIREHFGKRRKNPAAPFRNGLDLFARVGRTCRCERRRQIVELLPVGGDSLGDHQLRGAHHFDDFDLFVRDPGTRSKISPDRWSGQVVDQKRVSADLD